MPSTLPATPPKSSRQRESLFRKNRHASQPVATTDRPSKEERRRFLRLYAGWLRPYRRRLVFVFVLSLIVTGLDLLWPGAIYFLINLVTSSVTPGANGVVVAPHTGRKMVGLVIAAGFILFFKQATDSFRSYRVALINAQVIFNLRRKLFQRLLSLSLGTLGDMKSGGIVSRLSADVESVSGLVQMAIISPGVAFIRVVATVAILTFMSWRLALATFAIMPGLALASYLWLRKVRPIYRSIREDVSNIDARVNETFGGIRVVRAFRRENRERRTYSVGHHTVIRKTLLATRVELLLEAVWGFLIPLTTLLLVFYGGWQVVTGTMKVAGIFVFQIYAVLLLQPIWLIVQSVSSTQKSLAAMERIFTVLEMPSDKPDVPGALPAPKRVERFQFHDVAFAYRPGLPVVRHFSLDVPGGATVALVGASGAGKTTITDLVARFHDPSGGRIELNGVDLKDYRLAEYRSMLAIVQQDTFLFDGTIRQNIAYGRNGATDEAIIDSARRANADGFIRQLSDGYDTHVGERGTKLSGGQRQRISIARAILADPQILILDEATSNLDSESEQLIQAAMVELLANRTTFVIAHRLSTITHADLIVVMDAGEILEVGTHDALLAKAGPYRAMVERQSTSTLVD